MAQRSAIPARRSVSLGALRKSLLGLSPEEATFARRGFPPGRAPVRERLERVGKTFLHGYHAALEETHVEALPSRLQQVEPELRGFAFEGAAMGLALLDLLGIWRRDRWASFVQGDGAAHVYMVYVGAGWAHARFRRPLTRRGQRGHALDPLLKWLMLDGYGFHEGYFHPGEYVKRQVVPQQLSGYERRVFDQGLGRSIWFSECADQERISTAISAFPSYRRGDLWSGVGLACAYAGGASDDSILALRGSAKLYVAQLAQGAAFAAKARERAQNPAPHTETACRILCGLSAAESARITDSALKYSPTSDDPVPAYEVWRQRVQGLLLAAPVMSHEKN